MFSCNIVAPSGPLVLEILSHTYIIMPDQVFSIIDGTTLKISEPDGPPWIVEKLDNLLDSLHDRGSEVHRIVVTPKALALLIADEVINPVTVSVYPSDHSTLACRTQVGVRTYEFHCITPQTYRKLYPGRMATVNAFKKGDAPSRLVMLATVE